MKFATQKFEDKLSGWIAVCDLTRVYFIAKSIHFTNFLYYNNKQKKKIKSFAYVSNEKTIF